MRKRYVNAVFALSFASVALSSLSWGAPVGSIPLTSLTLNGTASIFDSNYLSMVTAPYQAASAFIPTPYTLGPNDSFYAEFEFVVYGGASPGDGLAFVAQNNGSGPAYLGQNGSGLGFYTLTSIPAIAATFDFQYNQIVNTSPNTAAIALPQGVVLAQATPNPPILGDSIRHAWITYDNPTKTMSIYYATAPPRPSLPIVTTVLTQDLSSEFGGQVYLGLTAGTGSYDSQVDILALRVNVINH